MAGEVSVPRVTITRRGLAPEAQRALREVFGIDALPLAPAEVEIELDGVPTAVVNALRRTVLDEMPGRALQVPPDGFDAGLTTDAFVLPQFLNQRIGLLRLRPQIPAKVAEALVLELDVLNSGADVLAVYAGDLRVAAGSMPDPPLFNPTAELCALQPEKRVVVRGIRVAAGCGRSDAAFNVACQASFTHLDLPQYGDAAVREEGSPEDCRAAFAALCVSRATGGAAPGDAGGGDEKKGCASDLSGYKVSSLVANPRRHLVRATLPATAADPAEIRAVFTDACANIKERLRLAAAAVADHAQWGPGEAPPRAERPGRGVQFAVVQLAGGLSEGVLHIPGETHTIGELLRREVFECAPDVSSVTYRIIAHENNKLLLSVHYAGDPAQILAKAVQRAIAIFDAIQRGIIAAR